MDGACLPWAAAWAVSASLRFLAAVAMAWLGVTLAGVCTKRMLDPRR